MIAENIKLQLLIFSQPAKENRFTRQPNPLTPSFPNHAPPRRQHFPEKILRCPFHSKSAPRNQCPPQLFDASYALGIDSSV
jgi:hypothetical protein